VNFTHAHTHTNLRVVWRYDEASVKLGDTVATIFISTL